MKVSGDALHDLGRYEVRGVEKGEAAPLPRTVARPPQVKKSGCVQYCALGVMNRSVRQVRRPFRTAASLCAAQDGSWDDHAPKQPAK